MPDMKSISIVPPHGWRFFESRTGWPKDPKSGRPNPNYFGTVDFYSVRDQIIQHRKANPRFSGQWSTDPDVVEKELRRFNAILLSGDPMAASYITGGDPSSKKASGPLGTIRAGFAAAVAAVERVSAGVAVALEWLGEGLKPVSAELATKRAAVCAGCPANEPKDLTSFFTVPAAALIRQQIEIKNDMKCVTPYDDKLGICTACGCPMKTKVWTPLEHISKRLLPASREKLLPVCWIPREEREQCPTTST